VGGLGITDEHFSSNFYKTGGVYYDFTFANPNLTIAGSSLQFEMHSVQETVWHKLDPNYVDFVLESPGGKKFRVTVSDSGALSAVEIAE
jgi:hypothetical protein